MANVPMYSRKLILACELQLDDVYLPNARKNVGIKVTNIKDNPDGTLTIVGDLLTRTYLPGDSVLLGMRDGFPVCPKPEPKVRKKP